MQKFFFVQELVYIHNQLMRSFYTTLNQDVFIQQQLQMAESEMPSDGWDGTVALELINDLREDIL